MLKVPFRYCFASFLLFALVAIPGLVLLLGSTVEFCSTISENRSGDPIMTQIFCVVVGVLGIFMMLLGVRKWGCWKYLYVFLSIPISLGMIILLCPSGNKFTPVVITGVLCCMVLRCVQNHGRMKPHENEFSRRVRTHD